MERLTELPAGFVATREALHRLAAHVLGRRRHQVTGRFGLRVGPGGFSTPAFGDGPEVVRVAGAWLVREVAGDATYRRISGSTLRDLAGFAGADLTAAFSVGGDTPELGDVDQAIDLDDDSVRIIAGWYELGSAVLDHLLAAAQPAAAPATVQLWPEHFDVGSQLDVPGGQRVSIGASPGDESCAEPYLYVSPGEVRPGDPAYWNVAFGASLPRSAVLASASPVNAGVEFLGRGLAQFG